MINTKLVASDIVLRYTNNSLNEYLISFNQLESIIAKSTSLTNYPNLLETQVNEDVIPLVIELINKNNQSVQLVLNQKDLSIHGFVATGSTNVYYYFLPKNGEPIITSIEGSQRNVSLLISNDYFSANGLNTNLSLEISNNTLHLAIENIGKHNTGNTLTSQNTDDLARLFLLTSESIKYNNIKNNMLIYMFEITSTIWGDYSNDIQLWSSNSNTALSNIADSIIEAKLRVADSTSINK